ncbi:GyrI-like domain-containing protein [bacterium]
MKKRYTALVFVLIVCFSITLFAQEGEKKVDYQTKIVKKEAMHFTGITARTSVVAEDGEEGKISQLWGRFMQEGLMMKIPGKVTQSVFGLYYDYDFGEKQAFTVMVGCQVADLESIPEGLEGFTAPASRYAEFTTPSGNMIQVVKDGWDYIWGKWTDPESKQRSFVCDFEEYGDMSMDMENAVVKLYVSLK